MQAAAEHASSSTPRWQLRRRTVLAAAAALLLLFGIALWTHHQSGQQTTASRSEQAQTLLDEFHHVMPRYPESLRDERRRHDLVATALPTLRSIMAFHQAHPEEALFGSRIIEFELYAALIGAPEVLDNLERQASAGNRDAAAKRLTIELVKQRDRAIRSSTLAELGELIAVQPQMAGSIIQCLRAAELTTDEAEQLATSIADPVVAKSLIRSAQLAAMSPRRLLDQPLELYGKLSDDHQFSTSSLLGRPVVVCFWASWCIPSLAALDEIQRVRQLFPELAVVGVSCDHDIRDLRNYLADHARMDWPQLFDRTRPGWHELAFSLGVQMVPFLILIDAQGIVRDVDLANELESAVGRQLGR